MIIGAEIIEKPYSGCYKEVIYDIQGRWNSSDWSWIKIIENDTSDWCGEFRGFPLGVTLSKSNNTLLVLTKDYLYLLDCHSGRVIEYEENFQYRSITTTPLGTYVIATYYDIYVFNASLKEKKVIDSPIEMDCIEFKGWRENNLSITCIQFLRDKELNLEMDGNTLNLTLDMK